MKNIAMYLIKIVGGGADYFGDAAGVGGRYGWVNDLYSVLTPLLYAIMAVVGAAGAIYAIVLGVQLARAEDQSKRDEAKKRLITVLIAVAVTIALVLFFNLLLPTILVAIMGKGPDPTANPIKIV